MELAKEIAAILDADPIAARQLREYLSNDRLIELLEIKPPHTPDIDEALNNCDASNEDISDYCRREAPLSSYEDGEILEEAKRRTVFSDEDIMKEVRERWSRREFDKACW